MKRAAILFPMLGIACEQPDEDIAWLQAFDRVHEVLDANTPARTWDLHVETNAGAERSGPTWTTLDVETIVAVDEIDPGPDLWVDVSLTGDEVVEESTRFTGPAQTAVALRERYQADCVASEPCAWDYTFTVGRREGSSGVTLDFTVAALVTLGPVSEAPENPALAVSAEEIAPE